MTIFEKERMGKAVTKIRPQPNFDLKEPPLYKILYINDNVTTVEFVVETLIKIFDHSPESAEAITSKIHDEGSGIAAILPYEMAEQKGVEVTQLARNKGFPLVVKLEPDV
jgi:ATP-dependent Clp protease adaptor protein ClpS